MISPINLKMDLDMFVSLLNVYIYRLLLKCINTDEFH